MDVKMAGPMALQMADLMAGYWVIPIAEKKVAHVVFHMVGYWVDLMARNRVVLMAEKKVVQMVSQKVGYWVGLMVVKRADQMALQMAGY